MHTRSKYKTRQKEIILDYLKSVTGTHITAGDVTRHFKEHGIPVGQATVYRQLENLVEQGMVSKYIIDSNSPACFEYTGADSHQQGASCFHCKCEKCGWGEKNPITNTTPLQIHHIDGNCKNNKEENLQLLCPNCHSLTETFGRLNKNSTRKR